MISFNSLEPEYYKDNVLLVDFLNLSFRFKHQHPTKPFSADMLRLIQSLAKSYKTGTVILCADYGSSAYRKSIYEGYKGGRADKFATQTEQEKEEYKKFLENYEEAYTFCSNHYIGVKLRKVEADDTIAYFARHLSASDSINSIVIASTDGDLDQCLADNVMRFSFKTRKEYTIHNFFEEHGCDTPEQYTHLKVLMGDSGDSVPGIESIGPKRGYVLLREYGTSLDVYDAIPLEGKQKFINNINNSGELIPINYKLMDLPAFCEDAIAFPDINNLDYVHNILTKVIEEAK